MLILVECLSNLNQIKQYTHAFALLRWVDVTSLF